MINFQFVSSSLAKLASDKADAIVVFHSPNDRVSSNGDALSQCLRNALKGGDVPAELGRFLPLYAPAGCAAKFVFLVSVGKGDVSDYAAAIKTFWPSLQSFDIESLTLVHLANNWTTDDVTVVVQALADHNYVYSHTKPGHKANKLRTVKVCPPENAPDLAQAVQKAAALAQGVELAKEWGNRPGNHAKPVDLAQAAQELASAKNHIRCQVMGPAAIKRLKMGAFAAVAQGSDEEARFIVLHYQHPQCAAAAPVVLVGKGVTFDTGGISLKPAAEMDEMKFDMCGAASVLGVFKSLSLLQPRMSVVGLIPSCENMPSGKAIKPGDVVTSMNGQTIEILNTDAEGRLILCDALEYAKRFKPSAVIDIATLTGACVIALGTVRSGLFSNNDYLANDLLAAGNKSMDLCWRMPLDDEYAQGLKSHFADLANVAGRSGGSVVAAKFLQRFVGDLPWAHLDIAGTAWRTGAQKGATGRPVPMLMEFLLSKAAPLPSTNVTTKPTAKRPGATK